MFILETVYEKEKKKPFKYLSELVFVIRILPLYIYIYIQLTRAKAQPLNRLPLIMKL